MYYLIGVSAILAGLSLLRIVSRMDDIEVDRTYWMFVVGSSLTVLGGIASICYAILS